MSPPMPRLCGFTNCVSPSIRSLKRRDAVGFQFRISAALSAKSRAALSSMPAISLRSTDRARACVRVASHGPVSNPRTHARRAMPSLHTTQSPRPLTPSDAGPSPSEPGGSTARVRVQRRGCRIDARRGCQPLDTEQHEGHDSSASPPAEVHSWCRAPAKF